MKRKIKYLLISLIALLPLSVNAATGSVRATASSSKVTINNTFNVTVTVSSTGTLGSWDYGLSYDSSKISLQSGDPRIVGYGDGTYKSKTYSYRFKAIALGSASISFDFAKIADWDTDAYIGTSSSGVNITISEPVVVNYSANNNLSALSVEEFELSPIFDKSTLEYSVTTLPTTALIKIDATAADKKAKISGAGEREVIEGENKLDVVVTAENGATKTYTINVIVPEKDPIAVKVGDKTYSILRKLPEDIPLNFKPSTVTIENEEINALYSEALKLTLVYARDENNNPNFYTFINDQLQDLFIYFKSDTVDLFITKTDKIISDLKAVKGNINGQEVDVFQLVKNSEFYIVYATDMLTNEAAFYSYDRENKTFQRFDETSYNYLLNNAKEYLYISYALGGAIVILTCITLLMWRSKRKISKIKLNKSSKEETIIKEELTEEIKEMPKSGKKSSKK